MATVLGQGRLTVSSAVSPSSVRQFGFQISKDTIRFYDLAAGTSFSGTDWWTSIGSGLLPAGAPSVLVPGHAVISALPATPHAAFFELAIGGSDDSFSLNIRQPGAFGKTQGGQGEFRNLNIVFTQTAAGVAVSGSVELLLFGATTASGRLVPALSEQGLLTFETAEGQVPIEAVGSLANAEIKTKAEPHPWQQLQLLYSFEEGARLLEEKTIHNATDKGPLALTVETPDHAAPVDRGLAVTPTKVTGIATAPIDSTSPLAGERPIDRLIQACQAEDQISVVLWIQPQNLKQSGPARILTLSTSHSDRNLMIGQDGDRYVVRLRTFDAQRPSHERKLRGDRNGRLNNRDPLTSRDIKVQQAPTCLVLTYARSAADDDRNVHLYVNGQRAQSLHMRGDLQSWETFELAIANEFNNREERNDRHWSGIFYRVEIYSQALTEAQVQQLYYPSLDVTVGDLTFENLPKPLDRPVAGARLTYASDHSLLTAATDSPRQVTPQLQFDQIQLAWKKQQGPWILESDSQVAATLWQQNSLRLVTRPNASPSEFLPLVLDQDPRVFLLEGLGEIPVRDFELRPGSVDGRPQWQLSATVEAPHLTLPPPGRDFDFQLDFRLQAPRLLIAETADIGDVLLPRVEADDGATAPVVDRVLLQGEWLGNTLGFYGVSLAAGFLLRATTRFELPFSLSLGPIYRPGSTAKLADRVTMCPNPGCRQTMGLNTRVELDRAGFVATVNGEFVWEDGHGPGEPVQVPEFTTFELPIRPSDLLALAVARLERHQDEIFAPLLRSRRDFYVISNPSGGLLAVYGSRLDLGATLETQLPLTPVPEALDLGPDSGAKNRFVLEPLSAGGATLAVTLGDLSALAADYLSFLKQVSAQPEMTAAAFITLRQRLAERLPVPLDQALQYAYGYSDGRSVDLVGGMRLRVEYQNYQFVHPLDKTADSGFISSGTAYYALNFKPAAGYLGFDPFGAALGEPRGDSVAGLIDLLGLQRPHYRLLYPDRFAPAEGRIGSERAAVLIGADTYVRLEEATAEYLDSQTVETAADVSVVHFRGRALVIPEIAIFVQDQPLYVAVGTTLRQLAERFGTTGLRGRPQRLVHEGIENRAVYRFINLSSSPQALDLPVVQGDRLYF